MNENYECKYLEEIKERHRKLINDPRVDVLRCRDLQLELLRLLKMKLKEQRKTNTRIFSYTLILNEQRRKLTNKEIWYLTNFFCENFPDHNVSDT